MDADLLFFDHDGFDSAARQIIDQRRLVVLRFAERHHSISSGQSSSVLLLRAALCDTIAQLDDHELQSLAAALGLIEQVQRAAVRRLWTSGLFDQPTPSPHARASLERPPLNEVLASVVATLATSPFFSHWIGAFLAQKICRDADAADRLARELRKVPRYAGSQARNLLAAWCEYGDVALLLFSDYPCAQELMLLQAKTTTIASFSKDLEHVLAVLRADLSALYHALHEPDCLTHYQQTNGRHAQLWDQSLLHWPVSNPARQRYRERVSAEILVIICAWLADRRDCSMEEAEQLFTTVVAGGLPALISWRCAASVAAVRPQIEATHLRQITMAATQCFAPAAQQMFLDRVEQVQLAWNDASAPYNLVRLLHDQPSSRYRHKMARTRLSHSLVDACAARTKLSTRDAYTLLKQLITYGSLGLVPQRQWESLFDPRLWAHLWLFKLGRLDNTLDPEHVTAAINREATALGLPLLPRQVAVGVCNHFRKLRYYNSGQGEAVAAVPLHKRLELQGIVRLHKRWLVVPVELPISLIDAALHGRGVPCTAVIVFDQGSQCAVDSWVYDQPMEHVHPGLALFQAVWHPGRLHWPLRGIPETIVVPTELTSTGLSDVQQAARRLMAAVEVVENVTALLKQTDAIRATIQGLQSYLRQRGAGDGSRNVLPQLTQRQAHEIVQNWLHSTCFPNHQTDLVPAVLRRRGVALPGHDIAAAGWLLPPAGAVQPQHNIVTDGTSRYGSPAFHCEPGEQLQKRTLPWFYGSIRRFLFVQRETEPVLHYLTHQQGR